MWTWKADNADDLFLTGLDWTRMGRFVAPRGIRTREVSEPVCLELTNLDKNLVTNRGRKLNYVFALAEVLWIWAGDNSLSYLLHYNKKMAEFSDDGHTLYGAYGPRIKSQLENLSNKLMSDLNTRQGIITIWRENPPKTKDTPCTVMMHFMVRDSMLHLTVYMRSNDIWLGFPYDIHTFTTIQKTLAAFLDVGYGTYHHVVGSLHMYESDFEKAGLAMIGKITPTRMPRPGSSDLRDLWHLSKFLMDPDITTQMPDPHLGEFYRIHAQLLQCHYNKKQGLVYHYPFPYSEFISGE